MHLVDHDVRVVERRAAALRPATVAAAHAASGGRVVVNQALQQVADRDEGEPRVSGGLGSLGVMLESTFGGLESDERG